MGSWSTTGLFLVLAGAAVGLAAWSAPAPAELEMFRDEGELFFPDFTDPLTIKEMAVRSFNAELGEIREFLVKEIDGRWVIPSHENYPADAEKQMAEAASLVIDLRKAGVRSNRPSDHAEFGVIDPDDPGTELDGLGTKVTFRDAADVTLASLIIGKEVPERSGHRFARVPGQTRTYIAEISKLPDTRFSSWIETDLLALKSYKVDRVVVDNHAVREDADGPRLVPGERLELSRDGGSWHLPGLADNEQVKASEVYDMTSTLEGLTIVGVRAKPEGLTDRLEKAEGYEAQALAMHLANRGFYITGDRSVFSNEGELQLRTEDGVRYTLRFGGVLYGDADAVSAASEDEAAAKPEEEAAGPGLEANRYLLVTVDLDPSALTPPDGPRLEEALITQRKKARADIEALVAAIARYRDAHEGALPATLAALGEGETPVLAEVPLEDPFGGAYLLEGEGETFVVKSLGADQEAGGVGGAADLSSDAWEAEDELLGLNEEWERHEARVAKAEEEVARLKRRFGPWYYVISAESFDKLRLDREALVEPKPEAPETPPLPGGLGG